jgi:hypothetical protein
MGRNSVSPVHHTHFPLWQLVLLQCGHGGNFLGLVVAVMVSRGGAFFMLFLILGLPEALPCPLIAPAGSLERRVVW